MKYLIKIDRKSIKRNPNAGRKDCVVSNGSTTTIECNASPSQVQKLAARLPDHMTMISYKTASPKTVRLTIGSINSDLMKDLEFLESFGIKRNTVKSHTVFHQEHIEGILPEPDFFFKELPTDVTCWNCKKTFKHTKLLDNYGDCEDGGVNICPKCGTWDCCELQYENLTKKQLAEIADK